MPILGNILPIHLQEIIVGSSDPTISKQISKLEKVDKIRKIAPRLYSSNLSDPIEGIVRRNLFLILGRLYPGAILSHRSAFEFQPTEAGHIFLTYSYTRKGKLPGITLRFLAGHKPVEGDNKISGELFVSHKARAFLESFQTSKKSDNSSKCLSLIQLEAKLEQIIRVNGEDELNKIRDKARAIADELNMEKEYGKLNKIISALLTTQSSKILSSPVAVARALGFPYDPARMKLFEGLFRELQKREFKRIPERNISDKSNHNFAFFRVKSISFSESTCAARNARITPAAPS